MILGLLLGLGGGCAHTQKKIDLEGLSKTVESFHKRVRWKDYLLAGRYVVPERRQDFADALREHEDERNLDVSDYELEGVEVSPEGDRARVVSRMRWTRLPSPSMKDERVTSDFVYREGQWLLEKQLGGPFDGALP